MRKHLVTPEAVCKAVQVSTTACFFLQIPLHIMQLYRLKLLLIHPNRRKGQMDPQQDSQPSLSPQSLPVPSTCTLKTETAERSRNPTEMEHVLMWNSRSWIRKKEVRKLTSFGSTVFVWVLVICPGSTGGKNLLSIHGKDSPQPKRKGTKMRVICQQRSGGCP